ncbi:type II secretion system protein GspD [Janthinobacterium sp. HLX7-2]|uniref:type II secretion system protein GspD n=1 Tax=Janthinobacterium sp. HLX7-2 TaxID=1259331 RepID=UPI003F29B935
MKKTLIALLFWSCFQVHAAETAKFTPPSFDFQGVNVAQVVQLIYGQAMIGDYVVDPEVLADQRSVSFRYDSNKGDLRAFVALFFDSLGLSVTRRGGADFIAKKKLEELHEEDKEMFVYRPKYRELTYLTRLLSPLLKGQFSVNRSIPMSQPVRTDKPVPDGSATALMDQSGDTMIFTGSLKEIAMLKKLLPQVDDRAGEVMVRGVVYEVSSGVNDGSAFSLAVNLLGGKLSLANGGASPLDAFVRFKSQTIDAVFSALSTDSRFKVVSTPSLRVKSGKTGRFNVGQKVPVIGSVTYPVGGGSPVQSVDYQDSGVIFDLAPVVRDSIVDLRVSQQVSNFAVTQSGVNGSPTKIVREVNTELSMGDGEIVVLGGLAETKESEDHSGFSFLPAMLRNKSMATSKTEILLILQMTKI